ncbi:GNAT family N-acetyltransferase [Paenibacillus nasutitermitis]|uniref:N-acetyltransferase domain-containing protein n=1 Tax=Paenibacillus nasutitermitis TaxID=1652958 RepID=A0A917DVF6_9BACL|nr:GNAT family N-acetyltransferase [Paenibacillus nasutitermitis]GGD74229.1 hypothetical protein GCM10010911_35170 [Paenibacillus nasutitermitis]
MQIRRLSPEEWIRMKGTIITFALRYGAQRLSAAGLHKLRHLSPEALGLPVSQLEPWIASGAPITAAAPLEDNWSDKEPAAVVIALEGGKLAAFAFAADAGKQACLVVVHPRERGKRLGSKLMNELHRYFGSLVCSVAADNTASMKMCFHAGMKAAGLFTGPTGKPTLRFEC